MPSQQQDLDLLPRSAPLETVPRRKPIFQGSPWGKMEFKCSEFYFIIKLSAPKVSTEFNWGQFSNIRPKCTAHVRTPCQLCARWKFMNELLYIARGTTDPGY